MDLNAETVSRLKFIGKITKAKKIDTRSFTLLPDDIFTSIYRTIFKDDRNDTLDFLKKTICNSFELLSSYKLSKKSSDLEKYSNILTDLKSCKQGILNLKETYQKDLKFGTDIDVLLQYIDAELKEYE